MLRESLIIFFISLGAGLALAIGVSCIQYPIFDFAVQDLDWTKQWLITTVADYYGAAICLCVIAVLTEPSPQGVMWAVGFCILGSPICCLYCAYRLIYHNGLALKTLKPFGPLSHSHGVAMSDLL